MNKIKVLILQNNIREYRTPVYNILSDKYDLTVSFSGHDDSISKELFRPYYLKDIKIGPFRFHKGLFSLCKEFDVVIFSPNLHFPDFCLLPFAPHSYSTITHSIGFRASLTRKYDLNRRKTLADYLLRMIMLNCDAMIFYMRENIEFWKFSNKIRKRCFEARNTVRVLPLDNIQPRNSFLFVGTLYKAKGIHHLIKSYSEAYKEVADNSFPNLVIIGDGPLKASIESEIIELDLSKKIIMLGSIFEEEKLKRHFSSALVCISPNQAGLSVPKSMGYGVPYVTTKNAMTGGEIFHIQNGENGVLLDDVSELKTLLIDVYYNKEKYEKMGKNAQSYYNTKANVNVMAQGMIDAIEYSLSK